MDTQGYELKVLQGAKNTILNCLPVISVELKPSKSIDPDLISFLEKDLCYRAIDRSTKDYIFIPKNYIFPDNYKIDKKRLKGKV